MYNAIFRSKTVKLCIFILFNLLLSGAIHTAQKSGFRCVLFIILKKSRVYVYVKSLINFKLLLFRGDEWLPCEILAHQYVLLYSRTNLRC